MFDPECASQIQNVLRTVFHDDSILYDRSHFAGGLTNYNYIMKIHGTSYVIREPGFKTEEIINRAEEQYNNSIASDLGINSECVYFDKASGIKISRLIPQAVTFSDLNPASETAINAAAALLHKIHTSPNPFPNRFLWETELAKYESIVRSLDCSFLPDHDQLRNQLSNFIRENVTDFRSVPCHNDTVPENFLFGRRDKRTYLIDWEYSGMNDPAWDVAMYIRESFLPENAIRRFLSRYYGTEDIGKAETMKLKCMVMAQDLLWATWAMIRHYNGEDFLDYLYNRYSRFRRNLNCMIRDPEYSLAEMVRA